MVPRSSSSRGTNWRRLWGWAAIGTLASVSVLDGAAGSLDTVLKFIQATFPQLTRQGEVLYEATADGAFGHSTNERIGVLLAPPSDMERARRAPPVDRDRALLQAIVGLSVSGEIESVLFHGAAVRERDNDQFGLIVGGHPSWTQQDVLQALPSDAACSKRQAVLSRLPLRSWATFFGELKTRDAQFDDPSRRGEGQRPRSDAYTWTVVLESRVRESRRYAVTIEPFGCAVTTLFLVAPDFEIGDNETKE